MLWVIYFFKIMLFKQILPLSKLYVYVYKIEILLTPGFTCFPPNLFESNQCSNILEKRILKEWTSHWGFEFKVRTNEKHILLANLNNFFYTSQLQLQLTEAKQWWLIVSVKHSEEHVRVEEQRTRRDHFKPFVTSM